MTFSELHQKLAFTYSSRISIIYPNALNNNTLSYLFGDAICENTLEVRVEGGELTITENIFGVVSKTINADIDQIKKLAHDYFFKKK